MDLDDFDSAGLEESVRVFVRIRPLNKREIAEKQTIGWAFNETSMLEDTQNGQKVYAYDHCFGPVSSNQETYDIVGKPVVLKAMEGYNGTVFTYGQTGSGKTWTMRGCEADPGMMVLCIRDIIEWQKAHPEIEYHLKVAYLEVYNEEINDLLGDQTPASKNLKILSEDAVRGAVIGGLVEEPAVTAEDFMAILQRGEASRSYASTNMNAESSRSHTIYRVSIEAKNKTDIGEESGGRISYLNLVDLAGSERQKSTKSEGKVLKEGANINKSLLVLGNVINKLSEASKKTKKDKNFFIPYRDSKLTRILKQSLGGNTSTSVLLAVTPAPMHREETVSSLKFGQLCKSIKNSVKANDELVDDKTLLKQYRAQIADLKGKLEVLSAGGGGSGMSSQHKQEYDNKIRALESFLYTKGASQSEIDSVLSSIPTSSTAETTSMSYDESEKQKFNEKLNEQAKLISKLQLKMLEYQDFEETKNSFEEHEETVRQELSDKQEQLEEEKAILQNDRFKLLKDRSAIDEKENRIGALITNLDEKESKLRQLIATLKEQQEQWQRSITDLQKREDLVDDWQKNHKTREKKLHEIEISQQQFFQELHSRESKLIIQEKEMSKQLNDLQERETQIAMNMTRITQVEYQCQQQLITIKEQETKQKLKEQEFDLRERELTIRRKELESWDLLLREKDRKMSQEQKALDEREEQIKSLEEKVKNKELDNEKKQNEFKQKENFLDEKQNQLEKAIHDSEEKDHELKEKERELHMLFQEFTKKNEELIIYEKKLNILQEQLKNIKQREEILLKNEESFRIKENEFYHVRIAEITQRHYQEMKKLEDIITKQLNMVNNFQKEITLLKHEMELKQIHIHELEQNMETKEDHIQSLSEQLIKLEHQLTSTSLNPLSSANTTLPLTSTVTNTSNQSASSNTNNTNNPNNNNNNAINSTHSADEISPEVDLKNSSVTKSKLMAMTSWIGNYHHHNNENNNNNISSRDFISQLAVARNVLYQILDRYDAVPDTQATYAMMNPRNTNKSTPAKTRQSSNESTASSQEENPSKPHNTSSHGVNDSMITHEPLDLEDSDCPSESANEEMNTSQTLEQVSHILEEMKIQAKPEYEDLLPPPPPPLPFPSQTQTNIPSISNKTNSLPTEEKEHPNVVHFQTSNRKELIDSSIPHYQQSRTSNNNNNNKPIAASNNSFPRKSNLNINTTSLPSTTSNNNNPSSNNLSKPPLMSPSHRSPVPSNKPKTSNNMFNGSPELASLVSTGVNDQGIPMTTVDFSLKGKRITRQFVSPTMNSPNK